MMFPILRGLMDTSKADPEMALLFDRHYSRRKVGARQFMPPGETLVLRDADGTILFGWLRNTIVRMDGQIGINCTVFRNESRRQSSDVILEAEQWAYDRWGELRLFTYVNPKKISSANPGYCFKKAGWQFVKRTRDGKHLLEKLPVV